MAIYNYERSFKFMSISKRELTAYLKNGIFSFTTTSIDIMLVCV